MQACDILMPNYYPFWEGVSIDNSIATLDSWHKMLVNVSGGRQIIVSETGWPSEGNTMGSAVPSPENAKRYFVGFLDWAKDNNVPYFYFDAYDEPWKAANEGLLGAHWGIWDKDGKMKPGMEEGFG